ncbi:endo-1,4-beta-xylanase [Rathayibacter sp. YIM 133350]|uniref:endo-1,4-beta-xylanase n=1 Tax=Rathayibacter sp. YIM 133350 TaxID=3131992 RepID=UPI00307D84CB
MSSVDFEDGTIGTWGQSGGGGSTLSVVDVDGGKALSVSGRDADYVGIQSPTGLFTPGQTYTFSMKARLADGTAGSAGVRFVMKPDYAWIGNTTMTAGTWTTVTGDYTVPAGATPSTLQVYLGTGDLTPAAPYGYLVDDITITTAGTGGGTDPDPDVVPGGAVNPNATPVTQAQGTGNVAALTFDDGPNPGTTPALLDFLKANGISATFCVIGQNITAPGGADLLKRIVAEGHTLCNHSTNYDDMGSLSAADASDRMKADLAIIRTALGDPNAAVPFFRAPNGSWGQTANAAVALGMQPLGVVNTINDWATQDVPTLTANLRDAMKAGQIVLTHDGGGDRSGTLAAVKTVVGERLAAGWRFSLPVGAPAAPATGTSLSTGFENGLDGWGPRDSGSGAPTVATTTALAHGGTSAAAVTGRTSQGSGLLHDVTGVLTPGTTYDLSAWVRFGAGQPSDAVWLSMARTAGGTTSYDTLAQFTGVTNSGWTQVKATFQMGAAESAQLYFETNYNGTNTSDLYIDDIVVAVPDPAQVQDLTPIKDTVDFPVGVAIDSRETTGPASELLLKHFDQVTSENYMKPEAWYDAEKNFTPNPEADTLMRFAQENGVHVYGHNLVWHSQTPAWFFQDDAGAPLTDSAADQQVLKNRMRTHIFAVAKYLSDTYGDFGSDTNPLYAFDVVNEVVSDAADTADGLRQSEWHRILGEQFIDLAFQYANEAFNEQYAAEGVAHPVTLFINDYNTEQAGKQARLHALVKRLLERGVPVDGVGHQFHVSLSMPVETLGQAIDAFSDLDVVQAVTELDVTTGSPVTQANLVEQGYYYRDAFRAFRERSEKIFSVTVWGLTDGRSWRASSGAPLLFDDALQAKPAYYGVVDQELPARLRTANVFQGDVPLTADAPASPEWTKLPLNTIDAASAFQLRWSADHLTAFLSVDDTSSQSADGIDFFWGRSTAHFGRDGTGDVEGVVTERSGGYDVVVHLPLTTAPTEGGTLSFDVAVEDGTTTSTWNTPGSQGTLTLVEPLSYLEVVQAASAPQIDGTVDAGWSDADTVSTDKQTNGTGGATATVHTLWRDQTLYVLAEVADPVVDVSGSDPWIQDSVEIYLDAGNAKNGSYRYDDTQVRISADNVVSFGTGDEAFQKNRVQSATTRIDGGYVVEAAISLLEYGGLGTVHGMDFQVNDASNGARTGIRNWADPTGAGYQSTARWGVGRLVGPADGSNPGEPGQPQVTPLPEEGLTSANKGSLQLPATARPGETITVGAGADTAGTQLEVWLYSTPRHLNTATADAAGRISATIPLDVALGAHRIAVYAADGTLIGWGDLRIVAAPTAGPAGGLAGTGADVGVALVLLVLLLGAGSAVFVTGRRRAGASLPR